MLVPRRRTPPLGGSPRLPCVVAIDAAKLKGEDTTLVRDVKIGGREYKLCAVFDGHDGKEASGFCAERMVAYLVEAERELSAAPGCCRGGCRPPSAPGDSSHSSGSNGVSGGVSAGAAATTGPSVVETLSSALRIAFDRCHTEIRENSPKAGTTATVLIIDLINSSRLHVHGSREHELQESTVRVIHCKLLHDFSPVRILK